MIKLHEHLPTEVDINGVPHKIDMSFDNVLGILEMLKDDRLSEVSKVMTGLKLLFDDMPVGTIDELIQIWIETFNNIVNRGEVEDEFDYDIKGNPMPKRKEEVSKNVMSFEEDADYIYASFLQDYNIDLIEQQGKLHWYKFMALLNGLSDSTRLRKVIEIRQMPLPSGKGSEKQRQEVEKLKRHYALKKEVFD